MYFLQIVPELILLKILVINQHDIILPVVDQFKEEEILSTYVATSIANQCLQAIALQAHEMENWTEELVGLIDLDYYEYQLGTNYVLKKGCLSEWVKGFL